MTNIISVQGLQKSYGKNHVLRSVDFEVKTGSIFALLGSNGSGKTTTVNILSTLLLPDEGDVSINGYDVVRQDKKVRDIISLTGQYAAVDELLTGEENMLMMGSFSHVGAKTVKKRTAELLKQLELTDAAKRPAGTYSGGMRRRLDLAISLLAAPPIIFLDEPTTGLDPRSRQQIWRIVKGLVADGTTIFLTTQYLEEADQLADTIAVLNEGKIVAEGSGEALKRQVGGEFVELTFEDKKQLDAAKQLVDGNAANENDANFVLAVATDGTPAGLRELLNKLATKDLNPTEVNLRKPTLDDVFMQLTETKKEVSNAVVT